MKQKTIIYFLLGMFLPLTGCFYEHPSLTDDGELGVDPTSATVMANLNLSLSFERSDGSSTTYFPEDLTGHRRRVITEAYLNRQLVARQTTYADITGKESQVTIPVEMKLHARVYQLAVWVDYVESDTIADLYYDTQTGGNLMNIIGNGSYRGNTEWKDVFCGCAELDLTPYADQWNVRVPLDMELARPVARYELVADDVDEFLARISSGEVSGNRFVARFTYTQIVPTGYNVVDALPRQSLMYQSFKKTVQQSSLIAGQDFTVAMDYVFCTSDLQQIPATLEILSGDEEEVLAATNLNLPLRAGRSSTLRYSFLTADPNGGVVFDPEYDGTTDIDVPGIILPDADE